MESQPDAQGRALVGQLLGIQTEGDDPALMRMAQDCIRRMRTERLEAELEEIQLALPNVPEGESAALTERAYRILAQLRELG